MTTNEQESLVINAVSLASVKWKLYFNAGNADGCVSLYEKTAIMNARPFGTYTGSLEIKGFWKKLIDDGFSNVEYIDPIIKVIDETSAILSSNWKMNKASGVIHKELWVLQQDGRAKLREDDFEAIS